MSTAYQGEVDYSQTYSSTDPSQTWPTVPSYTSWGPGTPILNGDINVQTPFSLNPYQYVTGDVAFYNYTYDPGIASVTETASYVGATVTATCSSCGAGR